MSKNTSIKPTDKRSTKVEFIGPHVKSVDNGWNSKNQNTFQLRQATILDWVVLPSIYLCFLYVYNVWYHSMGVQIYSCERPQDPNFRKQKTNLVPSNPNTVPVDPVQNLYNCYIKVIYLYFKARSPLNNRLVGGRRGGTVYEWPNYSWSSDNILLIQL